VKYLLLEPQRRALAQFLRRPTLIALDYDGTLAPIAPHPGDAKMPGSTRALLGRVARRLPVIVLTGRSRIDALQFLGGIAVLEVIGSHGMETQGTAVTRFLSRVGDWRAHLAKRLGALAGVRIEDKRYSLSVHYRHAEDPLVAREMIGHAAGELEGARVIGGKQVVNLVPEEAPDKGAALLAACARLGYEQAVFAGDDDTDEPGFAAGRPGQVFSIRVGEGAGSRAGHYLRAQAEIDALLLLLLEASGASAPTPPVPTRLES
jgi:trehalose 6-phosphate phosphatase